LFFLTGDAGKEKTGLDGRFFCAWGLVRFGHVISAGRLANIPAAVATTLNPLAFFSKNTVSVSFFIKH